MIFHDMLTALTEHLHMICTLHTGASSWAVHSGDLHTGNALSSLAAAPLMADLLTWTDWETMYAPTFGPLHEFVKEHSDVFGFRVLEVPRSGLLKIPDPVDLEQMSEIWQGAVEQVGFELKSGQLLFFSTQCSVSYQYMTSCSDHYIKFLHIEW